MSITHGHLQLSSDIIASNVGRHVKTQQKLKKFEKLKIAIKYNINKNIFKVIKLLLLHHKIFRIFNVVIIIMNNY